MRLELPRGMIPHQPDKPSWDCDTCGRPWPCDPARERMRAEGDGTPLAVLMSIYLEEAVAELPRTPPAEVFERFITWTRPAPLTMEIACGADRDRARRGDGADAAQPSRTPPLAAVPDWPYSSVTRM